MAKVTLYAYQRDALSRMKNGCILNGNVGSGKSITSLAYYYRTQGGDIERCIKMHNPVDLYIITTAKKRNDLEWDKELIPFGLNKDPELNMFNNKVVIDSWQNITKYVDVNGAFFIFDEDKLTGKGVWVKTFFKIAKRNKWIVLSATPGDTWMDYYPIFRANGFFSTKREFEEHHVVYNPRVKFPDVDRYLNEGKLIRLRNSITVEMEDQRTTIRHNEDIYVNYDKLTYRFIHEHRADPSTMKDHDPRTCVPYETAAAYCYALRKLVNSDKSRIDAVAKIIYEHPRVIIFYNYTYELELLKSIPLRSDTAVAEYNGMKHQPVPNTACWVYFVQYTAGCEGWNCIATDTIVFYSQTYSYKVMEQAQGRIDRINTPYTDLYYYHLKSRSKIDLAISRALRDKKRFNESSFYRGK